MAVSLSQRVYDSLLQKLLNNELVSGEILNRKSVASDLGVSAAPVLEAILRLENEGFLETIPRKGTQVKPIKTQDVHEQLIVREALECQAARLYCGQPIVDNEESLLQLADRIRSTPPFTPRHWRDDIRFHYALLRLTGCSALVREFHRITHLSIFHAVNRLERINGQEDASDHRDLLERLKTRDPDVAERVVREHVRSGKGQLA